MTWNTAPLSDVADVQGGIQKQPNRAPRDNNFPFLRVANVTSTGLDLADVHRVELFGDELERFRLIPGDLLVVEGNGSPSQVGRAAVWNGAIRDCVHQNHLIRIRPRQDLLPQFLGLLWNSPSVRDELTRVSSSTSGLHTLSVAKLKRLAIPVPPIGDQQRIVEILEDHLSRLDAADRYLGGVGTGALATEESWLRRLAQRPDSEMTTVGGELREARGGWSRSSRHLVGGMQGTAYLKMNNISRRGALDLDQLVHVEAGPEDLAKYALREGDVLFNSKNSGDLIGKTALADARVAGATFNENIMRLRFSSRLDPAFVLLWFLGPTMRSAIRGAASASTNVAAVYRNQLVQMPLWVPSREEQALLVLEFGRLREGLGRLSRSSDVALRRSTALRRAALAAAFEGKLTGRHTDQEVTEELADAR